MDNIMADSDNEEAGEINIALRTRSHLRIDNFVPSDNLNFPDVDMNLYQNPETECDPEYKKFLNQCYSEELGTDTNTDDNDPEYVYNDDIFSHGWRFNLDEVSELHQDETNEIQQQSTDCYQDETGTAALTDEPMSSLALPATLLSGFKSPMKQPRRKIDMFDDPEFARILNQQLRQHIQLLTQTFLLTRTTTNMRKESDEAKSHLCSYMKIFKNKSKPSNLLGALKIVNNLETPKDLKSSIRLSWRPLPIPDTVSSTIRDNPHVFIYPSLLPQVAFSFLPEKLIPKKPKINFTINEDKLLAYALHEFKGESAPYAFIASLLMTAKTRTQISNHIKNIKRSPGNENNPIKLYYANGQLPEINLDSDSKLHDFTIEEVKSPVRSEEVIEEDKSQKEGDKKVKSHEEDEKVELQEGDMDSKHEVIHKDHEAEVDINEFGLQRKVDQYDDGFKMSARDQSLGFTHQEYDDLMNMDLDDLMAASTTISKSVMLNVNNSESNNNNKNIKNLKLKKSMLNLMSHNFLLSKDMGDLIIDDFLKTTQQKLSERNNTQLLQLLAKLKGETERDGEDKIVAVYRDITKFLENINAPPDIHERVVLFLDLDQATKCGCASSYLHWMRYFEFMQHVEMYHDGVEIFEKKLTRLLDALQKDDPHKVKLAIGNLVNKHPFLKREFESLSLDEKPHPSLFICEEDFDDITDPISMFDSNPVVDDESSALKYEHFQSKPSKEELSYATPSCPCQCHSETMAEGQPPSQHCGKCNLKFMKGRMYLVNKIKPILAEWTYTMNERLPPDSPLKNNGPAAPFTAPTTLISYETPSIVINNDSQLHRPQPQTQPSPQLPHPPQPKTTSSKKWTFEEDREILEFCRLKAEQNEDTVSFDTSTFEELIMKRKSAGDGSGDGCFKKSAREIAERFNQLIDMYKGEM